MNKQYTRRIALLFLTPAYFCFFCKVTMALSLASLIAVGEHLETQVIIHSSHPWVMLYHGFYSGTWTIDLGRYRKNEWHCVFRIFTNDKIYLLEFSHYILCFNLFDFLLNSSKVVVPESSVNGTEKYFLVFESVLSMLIKRVGD